MDFFGKVVGQELAKKVLTDWLEDGKLPQTLMFVGPNGVGRRMTAGLLAEALHGSAAINHPDTFWFGATLASKREQSVTAPVKAAADDMVRFLERSPLSSKRKVAIIEDMNELTTEAQSALLKTLEEPHANSLIVMIATNELAVLPTILSRAQVVRFVPLTDSQIKQVVPKVEEEILRMVAGSVGRAQKLMANKRTRDAFLAKVDFWNRIEERDLEERWAMSEKAREREAALELVEVGIDTLRNKLIWEPSGKLAKRLEALQTTRDRLGQMANPRMALDALLLVL